MKESILIFLGILSLFFIGCEHEEKPERAYEYARLTRIKGHKEVYGLRYFWETRTEKTEAMNFDKLHEYFGAKLPLGEELKVTPWDYNVIDKIHELGWRLVAVNSSAGYSDPPTIYSPIMVYHFVR